MISDLWHYRSFVLGMVQREFQSRHLNSLLGSGWAVLQPLAMIALLTLVFGGLMSQRIGAGDDPLGYSVFLCVGVIVWSAFTDVVTRCLTVFVDHGNLLKKLRFPRGALPAVVVISAALNASIVFAVLILFLAVTGRSPGWAVLAFLPVVAMPLLLALGVGVTLGVLNVFVRDVAQIAAVALQCLFWLTPIVYPLQILAAWQQRLLRLNPLTPIAVACQDIVLHARWPAWSDLLLPAAAALVSLTVARAVVRRLADQMTDYL
jgi:lipopolysaccharide transport system permease protein